MKKLSATVGSIIIGGMLLAGCGDTGEAESKTVHAAEIEAQSQDEEKIKLTSVRYQNIEQTEYDSVVEYMNNLAKDWKEGSQYRQELGEKAEDSLARLATAYVNYFDDEITELGLWDDFYEFQLIADDIVQSNSVEEHEEHAKKFENKMNELLTKINEGVLVKLKEKKVEYTEYSSLEVFVKDIAANWKKGSEIRELYYGDDEEPHLANVVIAYTNYFEHEITELGMNNDFDRFQLLANNVIQNYGKHGYEEHKEEFENQIEIILSQNEGTDDVKNSPQSQIKDWATKANEILTEPLDDPKYDTNNDEYLEYELKAQKVVEVFPKHLLSEDLETEYEKVHSGMFLLVSEILHRQHFAESEKDFDELRAKFEELKQYVEEVMNKYQ